MKIKSSKVKPNLDISNPNYLFNLERMGTVKTLKSEIGIKGTFEMLIEGIKKINVRSGLIIIANGFNNMIKKKVICDSTLTITRENLAYLGKALLCYGNIDSGDKATPSNVGRLCLIYNDLDDDNISKETNKEIVRQRLQEYAVRKLQFANLSNSVWNALPRAITMFNDINSVPKDKLLINIDDAFKKETGLSVKEHVFAGIGISAKCQESIIGSLDNYLGDKVINRYEIVKTFLNNNSVYIQAFRDKFEISGRDRFGFNQLMKYPLIKLNEKEFICPILSFLWDKITSGIYYILFDKYKEQASTTLGSIFEYYVGSVLSPFFDKSQLFPEIIYKRGKSMVKSPDWIVKEGHWITIFECKIKRMRQEKTKRTGNLDFLDEDLEMGIVKGLKQINDFIADIKNKLIKELYDVNHFIPVIVTLEDYFFANEPMFKRRIDNLLLEKYNIRLDSYHVISIDELEDMLPVFSSAGKRKNLRAFISKKENDIEHKFDSFGTYLSTKYSGLNKVNNKVRENFRKIADEGVKYYFGPNAKYTNKAL